MPNLLSPEPRVKPPSSIIPYFDRIVIWLRRPVDRTTLEKLRKQCGELYPGPDDPLTETCPFSTKFKQRLDFKQPSDRALRWIASHCDGLVNWVEVTLDLIFATAHECAVCRTYFHRYLRRRWHCGQKITFYHDDPDNERYDGPSTAPNIINDYTQQCSRITGECYCLHVEWKMRGVGAVRAGGILRPRDLLTFDHRAFWEKRLLLYKIDPARLGRLFRNREAGTRSHRITAPDRKLGNRIVGRYKTIQKLLDHYSSDRIGHVLTPISSEPFLPPRHLLYINPNYDNSSTNPDRTDTTDSTRITITLQLIPIVPTQLIALDGFRLIPDL
jgi:hypothetical protein